MIPSNVKNLYMRAKGYTPIKLKDTKNVLKDNQKYKYVKRRFILEEGRNIPLETTILPSGTIVEFRYPFNNDKNPGKRYVGAYFSKTVFKKVFKNIYSYIFTNLERKIDGKLKPVGGQRGLTTNLLDFENNNLPDTVKYMHKVKNKFKFIST